MYLLDTNVLSELRPGKKQADEAVLKWAAQVHMDEQYISPVSLAEIEWGILRLERRLPPQGQAFRAWFKQLEQRFKNHLLVIDGNVAHRYAVLQTPDPMPVNDAWIAATALAHGMTIVSRNTRNFRRAGVKVLDPWHTANQGVS